jgi:hypothetical protein
VHVRVGGDGMDWCTFRPLNKLLRLGHAYHDVELEGVLEVVFTGS